MKIGFCYDVPENHPRANQIEDAAAEYESEETIDALADILAKKGEVIHVPWHQEIFDDLREHQLDVVFNIVESWGSRNRESYIPNICEILDIPYTGSDGLAMGLSLDKALTKNVAQSLGIKTPLFQKVYSIEELQEVKEKLEIDYPLFLKPNSEGSSIGIRQSSQVTSKKELYTTGKKLLKKYQPPVIIEEFLPGREFVVAVLGNEDLKVFPVAEILVDGGNFPFYSYEFKGQHQKSIKCPVDIEKKKKDIMKEATIDIFKTLECRDIARADFKLNAAGEPSFLEINPLPGLSPYYGVYPEQVKRGEGWNLEKVIHSLINFALERK